MPPIRSISNNYNGYRFYWTVPFYWIGSKVGAVIRVRIRRSVVRIQVHVAIVPIRAEADGAHSVRIHEVGVNSTQKIPYVLFVHVPY